MVSSLIKSLPLIVVIMTAGVDGQWVWGVNYSPSYVCALKGSTVKISCTLTHPQSYKLVKGFWTKTIVNDGEPHNFCSDLKKRAGIQCNSEYKDTSSITLTAVTEADKHIYYCRFTTDKADGKWTGIPGVQLDVTDLQVETQQSVKEGDSVTLRCKSSCSLPEHTTFIWYRNTQILTDQTRNLHLQSVSRSDTGDYRCAVTGHEHLISPPVYLKVGWVDGLWDQGVNYSPSYVCALKGSTVKISCTLTYPQSDKLIKGFWTKPAVTDGESADLCSDPEKRGRVQCNSEDINTFSITLTAVTEADKHIYYCRFTYRDKIWTVIPGSWLDVTDLQVETQQSVKGGDSVTLRCNSSCSLPEHTTFIWFRNTQILTEGIVKENQLHLWSIRYSDTGHYQCAVRGNEHLSSPAVYLKVERVDGLWDQGVNYSPSYVCALKGSTVRISCTLTYPQSYKLIKGFWTKPVVTDGESADLCSDPEKRGRVQCDSEDINTNSITLMNVTEADKHIYYCRFTYDRDKRWTVIPGSWLDVADLQVETQQSVKEGDSVTLRCKSSCSLPEHTTFIWYRNTQILTDQTVNLHLRSVRRSDAGDYSCEIRGNNHHLRSPAVYINIEYPPRNVSASMTGSGVIVEGDSVTLNCISDSNPPALNFSWFKENETSAVGSGQSFSISSFNSSFSGRFYCEAQNKHGSRRSASVSLTVKGLQRDALLTVSGIVAGCGGLIFIIIIIIVFIRKKRRDGGAEVIRQNQEDHVDRSAETALTNDDPLYSLVSANQTDDLYSNITVKKPERSGRKQTETDSGDVKEVQYASVHRFKNKDMKTEEYDCIETHHPSEANRSEDVIYSSVK